jgi:hypothetical protein
MNAPDTGPREDAINAIIETIEDQMHALNAYDSLFALEAVVTFCRQLRQVIVSENERVPE